MPLCHSNRNPYHCDKTVPCGKIYSEIGNLGFLNEFGMTEN